MADSNREAKINSTNIKLVKFGIQSKMSSADSIQKTCRKWAINDFTKYNNINFITLLIMNIGVESTNYIKKSLLICRC